MWHVQIPVIPVRSSDRDDDKADGEDEKKYALRGRRGKRRAAVGPQTSEAKSRGEHIWRKYPIGGRREVSEANDHGSNKNKAGRMAQRKSNKGCANVRVCLK